MTQSGPELIRDQLIAAGVELVVVVTESWMPGLLATLEATPRVRLLSVAREEEGVGILAGAYAGGLNAALLVQNAGLLASCYSIVTLGSLCQVPMFLLVVHRGYFGETEDYHVCKGLVTVPTLEALGIPHLLIDRPDKIDRIGSAFALSRVARRPVAALLTREVLV